MPPASAQSASHLPAVTRREFLAKTAFLAAAASLPLHAAESAPRGAQAFRAAIIGHTGHGDYGHQHDLIFNERPNISVVAVADPDDAGRAKAAARCHALSRYADYPVMLDKERPQLVCVAPRWTVEHHAMGLAALRCGAHVYLEKPMTQTLAEADELLALAKAAGLKLVVAHQIQLAPNILRLRQALAEGLIGDLLELRAHGKQDRRAGGEDLLVLGVHLFALMRFLAGDALWCTARVLQQGRDITPTDAHPATEGIGPVAGDDIAAQFAFAQGVTGTFTSRAKNRDIAGPWGLELIGSRSRCLVQMEMVPRLYILKPSRWTPNGNTSQWVRWPDDPTLDWDPKQRSMDAANQRVVDDWLAAIVQDTEPRCSGYVGMKALEMAHAVFAAGLSRTRVELPLKNREHPLQRAK